MKDSYLYGVGLLFILILPMVLAAPVLAGRADTVTVSTKTEETKPEGVTQGLKQYLIGNYEEAMVLLSKAAKTDPENAQLYYYLGLTYQGMLKYPAAEVAFMRSIKLDASQGNTYSHLGEIRYRLGRYNEAKAALDEAEAKVARPAYTQYLKGLTLMELADYDGAIEALKQAQTDNHQYKQKATYALGMIYKKQQDKAAAEKAFREAIAINAQSTAGVFASVALQSLQEVKKRSFRFDVGYGFYYDDNVLLKPVGGIAPGLLPANKEDFTHVLSLHANYTSELSGSFGFRADATYYKSIHHRLTMMDVDGFGISITPSMNGRIGSLFFEARADYYEVNGKKYMSMLSVLPKFSFSMGNMLQGILHVGYQNKQFLSFVSSTDEDRDGVNRSIGYTQYINAEDHSAWLALDYAYDVDHPNGSNWNNSGHRLSVLGLYPFHNGFGFRFNGDYYWQNYKYVHTVFKKKRRDRILTVSPILTYDMDWVTLLLQYSHVRSQSNLQIYHYSRNITGVGFEYSY